MEDFIRIWPGKVSLEDCQETISAFEEIVNNPDLAEHIHNNARQFSNSNLGRKDLAIFLENPALNKLDLASKYLYYIHDCLLEYIEEFGQLKDVAMSNGCCLKLQRTLPMGGYHVWHYENGDLPKHFPRELVWMIYLNDMPEGEGETEFLYQKKRIRPTQGTVVFWPAGMTHPHRGLTVYTQPKYILTGWYFKTRTE
jgi:hypothetical protein